MESCHFILHLISLDTFLNLCMYKDVKREKKSRNNNKKYSNNNNMIINK